MCVFFRHQCFFFFSSNKRKRRRNQRVPRKGQAHTEKKKKKIRQQHKMEVEKQSFLVQAEDGRKFKMVIRGDLAKIPVEKIRRYLKSFGVPEGQHLMAGDLLLTDDMIGEDFGLRQEDVLHLVSAKPSSSNHHANNNHTFRSGAAPYAPPAEPQVDVEGRRRQQLQKDELEATPRSASSRAPVRQAPSLPFDSSPSSHYNNNNSSATASQRSTMQEARLAHRTAAATTAHAASTPPPSSSSSAAALSSQWPSSNRQPQQQQQQLPSSSAAHSTPPRGGGYSTSSYADPSLHGPGGQFATNGYHAMHVHQQEKEQLEVDNAHLKRELEALRLELDATRMSNKQINPVESLLENAKRNLLELGKEIGMHLVLDQQLSCTIGTDERHTLLLSFDAPTERLYVFSSLLNSIPSDPNLKLRLYEALLDGAFLGRDMAGGGCGVSLQNGIVMMATSIQLRHCGPHALKDLVPVFIESLMRWRGVAEQICSGR